MPKTSPEERASANLRRARVNVRTLTKRRDALKSDLDTTQGKLDRATALRDIAQQHPDLPSDVEPDESDPAQTSAGLDQGYVADGVKASDDEAGVAGETSDDEEALKDEDGKPIESLDDEGRVDTEGAPAEVADPWATSSEVPASTDSHVAGHDQQ